MTIASNLSFVQNSAGAITTGTFNSGAGPMTFSIGGTEYNRVDGNGYSLLGYTTSQGAHKLQVNGNIYASGNIIGNITGNVTGVVSTASNLAGGVAGQLVYVVSPGISGFVNTSSVTVGTATNATNLLGGAAGGIPYQTSAGASTFLTLSGTANSVLAAGASAPQYVTQVQASNGTASYTQATGQSLVVTAGGLGVTGNSYFSTNVGIGGTLYLTGDLYVDGTQFIVNANTISSGDKALVLSTGSTTAALAVNAGLYIGATSATSYSSFYYDGSSGWILGGSAGGNLMLGGATTSVNGARLTVTGGANFTTIVTATTFVGNLTGNVTGNALTANTATSLANGAAGSIPYQNATSSTTFLAIGTNGYVLTSNGSAPVWTIASGVTAGNATNAANIATVQQTASASYYPTFVNANNVASANMSVYTTSSHSINPATGFMAVGSSATVVADAPLTIAPMGYINTTTIGDTFIHLAGDTTKRRLLIDSTSVSGPVIQGRQANGSQIAPTATSATNTLLFIDASGFNGTGYNTFSAAITMNAAENYTPTAAGSYISISTTPLQSLGTVERVRIDSTGSVLIGVTASYAGEKLGVNGNTYINGITTITNSIVQSGGYAYLGNYNTGAAIYPSSFAAGGQGLAFGLNFSNGNVEQNIWNTTQPSTYSGTGIRFMQYLTASTNRDLLFLSNTGAIAFGAPTNYGTAGQVLQSNGNSTATWVSVSGLTAGAASQVTTVQQTANASYYPVFVSANNVTGAAMSEYTTSSFSINPASGLLTTNAHTVNGSLTATGSSYIGSGVTGDVLLLGTSNRLVFNAGSSTTSWIRHESATGTIGIYGGNQTTTGLVVGAAGVVTINAITNSSSTTTGALIVSGGAGIGKTLMVGERITIGTTSTSNKFEVAGTAGQLFSVSDSFTGTVFSASDISGIPSIEVLDTGLVKLAQYNGLVTVSTGTAVAGSGLSVWTSTYILSLGVGTSGSGTIGEIRATNEVTAYYSDRRLKENVQVIDNAVVKVLSLTGITYTPNAIAESYGYDRTKKLVGVFADEIEAVLPEAVRRAPFDVDENGDSKSGENYKTVQYEKIVPLLIEAIKEQQKSIENLQTELAQLKSQI